MRLICNCEVFYADIAFYSPTPDPSPPPPPPPRLTRRVHGCYRCRRCTFTAPDSAALLEHFNSAHCRDSAPSPASLAAPTNGCSAPSTLSIKEESKGDLRLCSPLPPERAAEGGGGEGLGAVKSEALDEQEVLRGGGWLLEARGGGGARGDKGGAGDQAHRPLWLPKLGAGPQIGSASWRARV